MAATDQASLSAIKCPVCHDRFLTPKLLPCAHVLCRNCLLAILNADKDAKCPLCHDVICSSGANDVMAEGAPEGSTASTSKRKPADVIVDSLPTDVVMEARVECAELLVNPQKCVGCEKPRATAICLHCSDVLCQPCANAHKHFSCTRHHTLCDLATITPSRLAASRQIDCHIHPGRPAELYCPAHKAAICYKCVPTQHRQCAEVQYVEERVQETHNVLADMTQVVNAGRVRMDRALTELDRCVQEFEKPAQACLSAIDHVFDQLRNSVEACHKKLREQAAVPLASTKKRAQEVRDDIVKRGKRLASYCQLLERLGEGVPRVCAASDMVSTILTNVRDLDVDFTLPSDLTATPRCTLAVDEVQIQRIERALKELSRGHSSVSRGDVSSGDSSHSRTLKQTSSLWQFHANHGANITLTADGRTAQRVEGEWQGAVVFSKDTMLSNMLYEVRLDVTDTTTDYCYMPCGVTDRDPATLSLSTWNASGWKQAVIIGYDAVWTYDIESENDVGKALIYLQVGSKVGLLVDEKNSLHLYVDGQRRGVAARDIRRPCHALFDVVFAYKKISTLPLKTLS